MEKKRIKWVGVLLLAGMIWVLLGGKAFASPTIRLITDSSKKKTGEEIAISLQIQDKKVAAYQVELYFDPEKLEYVGGPDKINQVDNRILYTWFDEAGGKGAKEGVLEQFRFRAKQDGDTCVGVTGQFFDEEANLVEANWEGVEIKVGEEKQEEEELPNPQEQGTDTNPSNSYLQTLRINQEGLTPDFNKEVYDYYYLANEEITSLKITAISENPEAIVSNDPEVSLQQGKNLIRIGVVSKDGTTTKEYRIHVTKTDNLQSANADLENLAIEFATLSPEFIAETTNYTTVVAKDIKDLNVLAVPENKKATVKIEGEKNLKEGNNRVIVNVLAEDTITTKQYVIQVYRRNELEQKQEETRQQEQAVKLSAILEEQEQQQDKSNIQKKQVEEQHKKEITATWVAVGIALVGAIGIIVFFYRDKIRKWI